MIRFMRNLVITAYRECKGADQTIHFMVPYFGCEGIMLNDLLLLVVKSFNIATNQIHENSECITDAVLRHFKAQDVKFMMHTPQGSTSAKDTLQRLVIAQPDMTNVVAETRAPAEGIDPAFYMFMSYYGRFPRINQEEFRRLPDFVQKELGYTISNYVSCQTIRDAQHGIRCDRQLQGN